MKSYKKIIVFLLLASTFSGLNVMQCNGQNSSAWDKLKANMDKTMIASGYPKDSDAHLPTIIANIIKIILSFIGAVYLFMIIIAGWQWLFSGGNEEKTGAAMKRITHSTIGLIIVLAAYLLTDFITTVFIAATGVGKG